MTPRNRRTNESKSGLRDLAVKHSAAGRVKGGETNGRHFPELSLTNEGGGTSLGYAVTTGAKAAGTGAAG